MSDHTETITELVREKLDAQKQAEMLSTVAGVLFAALADGEREVIVEKGKLSPGPVNLAVKIEDDGSWRFTDEH